MDIKEDPPLSGIKEASIIVKETKEEKIVINQGNNSKGLHHKEDNSLPGIKIYFMVIVLIVLNLSINL
jgi:hypothetical protein